ncbi:hypothetical protein SAMN02745248_00493 [Hathewaya proteolytica DSM 3090]|uniref:Uncharacterized protein n=1 Tax=Hathewaya proteolytica DSM 3090 TaxID=1121331 RepID=A0A1M6KJJ8_9CLOT|nr:hypothetical protein [Hathewaya proteolytica]SHJ59116.1 hypothetical protein SAMN02745248_00493 [Hathewaya proteolytica DSM 3090]
MEIKLLKEGYKNNDEFYQDFLVGNLHDDKYLSGDSVVIDDIPDFPIYFTDINNEDQKKEFIQLMSVIHDYFLNLDREIYFNEIFWHSFLCLYKREYILKKYPQLISSENYFHRIVIKNFDWQNHIYRALLGSQYVNDYTNGSDQQRYYELIVNNLDLVNYIMKYPIFRNGNFFINILDIVDETNTSKIMKSTIKGRDDLGKDERYGRRVIFEFNKSYPIVLSPMIEKSDLKNYFLKFLSYYYQGEEVAATKGE